MVTVRKTCPPKPQQPRQDLERVGRRDRQWSERIKQPLRCLKHNTGRSQRHDVGKRKSARVHFRSPGIAVLPVEDCHLPPFCLERKSSAGSNDPSADHNHVFDIWIRHGKSAAISRQSKVSGGNRIDFRGGCRRFLPWCRIPRRSALVPASRNWSLWCRQMERDSRHQPSAS